MERNLLDVVNINYGNGSGVSKFNANKNLLFLSLYFYGFLNRISSNDLEYLLTVYLIPIAQKRGGNTVSPFSEVISPAIQE